MAFEKLVSSAAFPLAADRRAKIATGFPQPGHMAPRATSSVGGCFLVSMKCPITLSCDIPKQCGHFNVTTAILNDPQLREAELEIRSLIRSDTPLSQISEDLLDSYLMRSDEGKLVLVLALTDQPH
jgi:hypothetical protein